MTVANIGFVAVWFALAVLVLVDVWFSQNKGQAFVFGFAAIAVTAMCVRFYSRSWLAHRLMQKDSLTEPAQLFQIVRQATRLRANVKLRFDWHRQELDVCFGAYGQSRFRFAKAFTCSTGQLQYFCEVAMLRYLPDVDQTAPRIATIVVDTKGKAIYTLFM